MRALRVRQHTAPVDDEVGAVDILVDRQAEDCLSHILVATRLQIKRGEREKIQLALTTRRLAAQLVRATYATCRNVLFFPQATRVNTTLIRLVHSAGSHLTGGTRAGQKFKGLPDRKAATCLRREQPLSIPRNIDVSLKSSRRHAESPFRPGEIELTRTFTLARESSFPSISVSLDTAPLLVCH
jgi:hypothetical protein